MVYFVVILSALLVGCASQPTSTVPSMKSVSLEFKGKEGDQSETRYFSNARILTYEDRQLLRDHQESVEFTVSTKVASYDPEKKQIEFAVKTVHKDGVVGLHDLAFPELDEQIDYVSSNKGEVLKAGDYPPQSLFFVPALPMPNKPVTVGDSWSMEHTWLSSKDGIPFKLEVVGRLKGIVPCEQTKMCADLEISGHVSLEGLQIAKGSSFENKIWGRLLFSVERGDVLWSEMRSREEMGSPSDKMAVTSCMVSELKGAKGYLTKMNCVPGDQPIDQVPKL